MKVKTNAKCEKEIANSLADRSEFANPTNYIFGSSAAIITEVSLIVGLGAVRASKGAILGGLLTIALADNISDSLGIDLYKESEGCGQKTVLSCDIIEFPLPPPDLSEFCCDCSVFSRIPSHSGWNRFGAAITYHYQLFNHQE